VIALAEQFRKPRLSREARRREARERQLRFCVITSKEGVVDLRYFAHPADAEGVTIRLTPKEREELCHALALPGSHFVLRDDAAPKPRREP